MFLQTIGLKTYHETYDKDLSVGSIMLHDKMSGMSCKSVVMFLEWLLQPIAWPVKAHSLFLSGINGFLKAIQTDYSNICVTWTHFITDLFFFFFNTHSHKCVASQQHSHKTFTAGLQINAHSTVPPLPIRRVRRLRRAPTPGGGTIPVAKMRLSQKKNLMRLDQRPLTPAECR